MGDLVPRLIEGQLAVFELIARDEPFEVVAREIVSLAEELEPGTIAGITVVDRSEKNLEMAIFGAVDRAFSDALAGVKSAMRAQSGF